MRRRGRLQGGTIPGITRRPKTILFFESYETAAAVRRALQDACDIEPISELSTLKAALRTQGHFDAIIAEYGGTAHAPLVALRIAERSQLVPRRILLTPRGVTIGVLDVVRDHAATSLVFLPRCGEALRATIHAPAVTGRIGPRRAA